MLTQANQNQNQNILTIEMVTGYRPVDYRRNLMWDADCMIIRCPYDERLVAQIKIVIPDWEQREWSGKFWAVLRDNPYQVKGEPSNLDLVRRICRECTDRRGWLLADCTMQSDQDFAELQAEKEKVLLAEHIKAVVEVLPKLPPNSFHVVRWSQSRIQLKLRNHISDNILFKKLFNACLRVEKQWVGFLMDVANDRSILLALLLLKSADNLSLSQFQIVQEFDNNGTAHLIDSNGQAWLGIQYDSFVLEEFDSSEFLSDFEIELESALFYQRSWQLGIAGKKIYWIAHRNTFIETWLNPPDSNCYFGGAFGDLLKYRQLLPQLLQEFQMVDWFKYWAGDLLESEEVYPREARFQDQWSVNGLQCLAPSCWHEDGWAHPAEPLLRHLSNFYKDQEGVEALSSIDIIPPEEWVCVYEESIANLKYVEAAKAQERARTNAISLATRFVLPHWAKWEMVEFANEHSRLGVVVRQSWAKDRIIYTFGTCQELCELVIGLGMEASPEQIAVTT